MNIWSIAMSKRGLGYSRAKAVVRITNEKSRQAKHLNTKQIYNKRQNKLMIRFPRLREINTGLRQPAIGCYVVKTGRLEIDWSYTRCMYCEMLTQYYRLQLWSSIAATLVRERWRVVLSNKDSDQWNTAISHITNCPKSHYNAGHHESLASITAQMYTSHRDRK